LIQQIYKLVSIIIWIGDKMVNKRAQVWVETVVYTLIAFALIGAVIAFAKPKIEELQDRTLIEQSSGMLKDINSLISSIRGTSGNQRIVEVSLNGGALKIDGENELIVFEIESRAEYSQPGEEIVKENLIVLTEPTGRLNQVTLTTNYSEGYNITYEGKDQVKLISKAPTPHKVSIENKGFQDDKVWIDIRVI
tara:strand:- start:2954 stop:3532 length:579 start_codon:yes stop_codon:yes gene_type:complete